MNRLIFIALLLFVNVAWSNQNNNQSNIQEEKVRLIVHVLDYLKKDYAGAVQKGKVVNPSEYSEQMDFANTVLDTAKELGAKDLAEKAKALQQVIAQKRDAKVVQGLVNQVRSEVDKVFKLVQVPSSWPSLQQGQKLFAANCSQCHGNGGTGDGAAGITLNPKPTNFTDVNGMASSTPAQIFNTLKLGIANTGMRAFTELSDEDQWALSFYVSSLRHPAPNGNDVADLSILEEVAQATDAELARKYPTLKLSAIRHVSFDKNVTGFIQKTRFHLAKARMLYDSGNPKDANTEAVKAYLEGIEPIEPRLKASDFNLVAKIESEMATLRESLKVQNNKTIIDATYKDVHETLNYIEKTLANSHLSTSVVFGTSAAIFLREGFEAVLIVLALLSVLRAIGGQTAIFWVHAGWLSALLLGLVFWFSSGYLLSMSGAQREMLEAGISLFAVAVLLYVGFWLHSQTEVDRWKKFLGTEMKRIVESKRFVGLFVLSFIGVFRESVETVLFLRAIVLEAAPGDHYAVGLGVLTAFIVILLLAWLLMRFSKRVPIRSLFIFCAVTVAVLAVILMGKGIHSLQEVGMLSITSTPFNWRFEILGIFPSWECWSAQVLTVATAVALWNLGSKPQLQTT
jgi:high-affinity iron transporter